MKKTLSLLLVLAMVLTSFTAVFAADETEKTPGEILQEIGVLKGNAEGDLMLEKEVSRQDMIVLLSRLLGQEDEAKAFTGETTFKDIEDPYYVPYIAWAQANELTNGVAEGGEAFGFGRSVTQQEVLAFLLRALGYGFDEVEFENVAAKAAELKLIDDAKADLTVASTREVLAELSLKALKTKVKDSDKTLAEKLELTLPEAEKLEVKEVVADNLKEIKVVFNKSVDKDVAEDKDLYSTTAGSIKDAKVEEDNTVTLTLADGTVMTNKKEYKLTIKGYVEADSKVNSTFTFKAYDNTVPEVVEVVGLGTKAVKVVMSEPIKEVKASNFKVDGKSYYGSVKAYGKEIVLKPYGGTEFSVGDHTLVVATLEDYAGFKSVEGEFSFTVVEDKDAPTVAEVKGTLERIVVTFSEDVDDVTVTKDNLYWGGVKSNKAQNVVKLSGNRYAFEFSKEKALPTYEVTLTITGIKDYSGNEMSSTDIPFKAEIDQTRPEVLDAYADDETTIIVEFNKAVNLDDVKKTSNYSLTDEDGKKVTFKSISLSSDGKEITISLYSALKEDKDYTFKISGIRDNTKLANTMLPYEIAINAGSYNRPEVTSVIGKDKDRTIFVTFSKKMDVETISDLSNYFVKVKSTTYVLSEIDAEIDVLQDGKAVLITLPEKIDSKKVGTDLEFGDEITTLTISAVKDLAGNNLKKYGEPQAITTGEFSSTDEPATATATDVNTVEVKFGRPVVDASIGDFSSKLDIDKVEADGSKTVVITFEDDINADATGIDLKIKSDNNIESVAGDEKYDVGSSDLLLSVVDEIAPSLDSAKAEVSGTDLVITANFDEALKDNAALEASAKSDFVITRVDATDPIDLENASSTIDGNKVVITIPGLTLEDGYSYGVEVVKPAFVRDDTNSNIANETEEPEYTNELEILAGAKTALKSVIDTANALYTVAKPTPETGDKIGTYPQAAITTFKAAIDVAQAVYDNTESTVAELEAAKTDLVAAKTTFEATKVIAHAETVELTLDPTTVTKPGTVTADAVVKDQDGNPITGAEVTYEIEGTPIGVTIVNGNIIVVDSIAEAGTVTVKVTVDGTEISDTAVLTITAQ